jgi:hypothetical protein
VLLAPIVPALTLEAKLAWDHDTRETIDKAASLSVSLPASLWWWNW